MPHLSPAEAKLENLKLAIQAVEKGQSIKAAALQFQIPRSTLSDKVNGKTKIDSKRGPTQIFSHQEEKIIAQWIIVSGKTGFPLTEDQIMANVNKLLQQLNRKNQFIRDCGDNESSLNVVGKKWFILFLKRHPELSYRTPQNLTSTRAKVTRNQVNAWFEDIGIYLAENDYTSILLDPSRIFNLDEGAFFFNPKNEKVVYKKGAKNVYSVINSNEKECLTVLVTVSAAGVVAPTMVLFKYARVPRNIAESVPKEWGLGTSPNGWMTGETFYEFITNIFNPWLNDNNIKKPVIVFLDGHSSHLTLPLSRFCMAHGIILINLLPNSTHLMQPLDVAVFRPLKRSWKKTLSDFRVQKQQPTVNRTDFCPLLHQAIKESLTPETIVNGFKRCGLVPWDPKEIDLTKIPEQTPTFNTSIDAEANEDSDAENRSPDEPNIVSVKSESEIALKKLDEFLGDDKLEYFMSLKNSPQWMEILETEDRNLFTYWRFLFDETVDSTVTAAPVVPVHSAVTSDITVSTKPSVSSPSVSTDLESLQHLLEQSEEFLKQFEEVCVATNSNSAVFDFSVESRASVPSPPRPLNVPGFDEFLPPASPNVPLSSSSPAMKTYQLNETTTRNVPSEIIDRNTNSNHPTILAASSPSTPLKANSLSTLPDLTSSSVPLVATAMSTLPDETQLPISLEAALATETHNLNQLKPKFSTKSSANLQQMNAVSSSLSSQSKSVVPESEPTTSSTAERSYLTKTVVSKSNSSDVSFSRKVSSVTSLLLTSQPSSSGKDHSTPTKRTLPSPPKKKNDIPSPFKRALIWPGEKKNIGKRKFKEKAPSVASSREWQLFYEKKEIAKREIENEKKRKREEREEKRKHNKKPKVALARQKEKVPVLDEDSDFEDNNLAPSSLQKGDFVIVDYEEEHFPGEVLLVENDKILVKTMILAGIDLWKWPVKDDKCYYDFCDVKQKIQPPTKYRNRGHYKVPEMQKFK